MKPLEFLGVFEERKHYAGTIRDSEPFRLKEESLLDRPFALIIHCDQSPAHEFRQRAKELILSGAEFICCTGKACEEVHDIFDVAFVELYHPLPEDTITTIWSDDLREGVVDTELIGQCCPMCGAVYKDVLFLQVNGEDKIPEFKRLVQNLRNLLEADE